MTDSAPRITVEIDDERWKTALAEAAAITERAVCAALDATCPDLGEGLAVVLLTDDATLQALNRTWRGIDKPTNVLSFPAMTLRPGETPRPEFDGVPLCLGDMALAHETVVAEAEAQGKPLAWHVSHLVVHGTLHLLGYDHMNDADAALMESLETDILRSMGMPDPYDDNGTPLEHLAP